MNKENKQVLTLWISIVRSCAALFRSRQDQVLAELALRQQLVENRGPD